MKADPYRNVVLFLLARGSEGEPAIADADTLDEDCVEQAWHTVERTHGARADEVSALHTEWEPSDRDAQFIARTFGEVKVTYNLSRPEPGGWAEAMVEARRQIKEAATKAGLEEATPPPPSDNGERTLLPVLLGRSSSRGQTMLDFPTVRHPLVPGKVDVAFGVMGWTPHRTISIEWLFQEGYRQMGEPPMADVLEYAAGNLGETLKFGRTEGRDGGEVIVLQRDDHWAGSAVALPDFHALMSPLLGAERLIVGVPDHDNAAVCDADGAAAAYVQEFGLEAACSTDGFLGPSVFLVEPGAVRLVAHRDL